MAKARASKSKVQPQSAADLHKNDPAQPLDASPPVVSTAIAPGGAWITDKAWICGVAGALAVTLCAVWFNRMNALEQGVFIFGRQITANRQDTLLAALILCAGVMLAVEALRLWLWGRDKFFSLDPALRQGKYAVFLLNSLGYYGSNLVLLGLVILFFRSAGEYGFAENHHYYQPWFRLLEIAWTAYLWGGLPYVLLTRALKHSPAADRREMSTLPLKLLRLIGFWLPNLPRAESEWSDQDRKNARALLVKLFFTPLMTVFFYDQFVHLVNNTGYLTQRISGELGNYTHQQFNTDLFNITIALVFSIDTVLAWCGYVVSSRWVDNQTASAEPTMLGWMVCVVCYPPFQRFLGLYYSPPDERGILQLPNPALVTLFTVMMLLSYLVYVAATMWFGVRFSNLTNRGIIRKGPYAWVRHPAYASKNFAWWCVMFPAIIYSASSSFSADADFQGLRIAGFQIMGLLLMTWIYYLRALTEERHLSLDPAYRDYCRQVKHRFIPGVL